MYTWSFPFENAIPEDSYYKYLVKGQVKEFWKAHEHH